MGATITVNHKRNKHIAQWLDENCKTPRECELAVAFRDFLCKLYPEFEKRIKGSVIGEDVYNLKTGQKISESVLNEEDI